MILVKLNLILIQLILLFSCSILKNNNFPEDERVHYSYNDDTGEYRLIKEVGTNKKNKTVYVKKLLTNMAGDEKKPLEKTITVSKIKKLNLGRETISIMGPKISQHHIWLDGRPYFSQIKIDHKRNKVDIISIKNESQKTRKSFELPKGNGVFCFYGQLMECISITGFFDRSIDRKAGKMNFTIIWDSYPFQDEQFSNIPNNIYSQALFSFDGFDKKGNIRYSLKIEGQTIFFHLNRKKELIKKNWVVQGISQERI